MGEASVRRTRVCADGGVASGVERPRARAPRTTRRGGRERTGRVVNIEQSGHVWVQVTDGDESYSLRCMAMAPFEDEDLHSEVLVWEHSLGIGVVIARGLDSHPPTGAHTRESFVHTMDVQPHEVEDVAPEADVALAATALDPRTQPAPAASIETLDAELVDPKALAELRARAAEGATLEATVDGRRVCLDAADQLVLSCGTARIVIRPATGRC